MAASISQHGDVAILELPAGWSTQTGTLLQEEVGTLLAAGHKRILIDLEQIAYLDSMGLGALLASKKAAFVAGATLKLLRPQKRAYTVLAQTSLHKVFECFEDRESAIRSFRD